MSNVEYISTCIFYGLICAFVLYLIVFLLCKGYLRFRRVCVFNKADVDLSTPQGTTREVVAIALARVKMGFNMADTIILLLAVAFTYLIIRWLFIFLCDKDCRSCTTCWKKTPEAGQAHGSAETNQTADIWNISGRVNQEGGPITSEPHRWPTHDHHVTMSSFIVSENQPKRDRIPPPPYCEVDLPTYEQATGVAAPKNEVPSVHITPSSSRTLDGPTS